MGNRLNLELSERIAEFSSLIDKIFPKKIFYKLLLRGRGWDFDGYRRFANDEDASNIDWKASARSNNLLVKQYVEEKEMNAIFILDIGDNMVFGSTDKLKCEYSAELVASLAHVMVSSGNKVGFFLVNSKIRKLIPSAPGKKQFDILIQELLNPDNYGGAPNFEENLKSVTGMLNKSVSLVILVSDFLRINKDSLVNFERIGNLIETIGIVIRDPLDNSFPEINKEILIENPSTGEKLIINPKISKSIYEEISKEQSQLMENIFKESKIDYLNLTTDINFSLPLATFLKNRAERR